MLHTPGHFFRVPPRVSWGFIGVSLAAASVEGARRCAHECVLALCYRVYLTGRQAPLGVLQAGRRRPGGAGTYTRGVLMCRATLAAKFWEFEIR
jgi:hypothetical protein